MRSIEDFLPDPKLLDRKRAEPEEASVQPSPAEPPVTNKGTTRRSSGANDLVEGLLAMPTDHKITRHTQGMIRTAKIMMNHSDGGCVMMMFVEAILLADLQKEEVQANVEEPSDQALERYLASLVRDAVVRTRARDFPTLLYADTKPSGSSQTSIKVLKSSEEDVFWHALVVADRDNVRHFAY